MHSKRNAPLPAAGVKDEVGAIKDLRTATDHFAFGMRLSTKAFSVHGAATAK